MGGIFNALKERIELVEGRIRNMPVTAVNIRLRDDGALADLMVNGEIFKDQPFTYSQFFTASTLRKVSHN